MSVKKDFTKVDLLDRANNSKSINDMLKKALRKRTIYAQRNADRRKDGLLVKFVGIVANETGFPVLGFEVWNKKNGNGSKCVDTFTAYASSFQPFQEFTKSGLKGLSKEEAEQLYNPEKTLHPNGIQSKDDFVKSLTGTTEEIYEKTLIADELCCLQYFVEGNFYKVKVHETDKAVGSWEGKYYSKTRIILEFIEQ